jgi:hypothetical protein
MMEIAFSFYTRLIEVVRREHYDNELRLGDLPGQYQNFRIAARVLEEQLRVYLPNGEARWLWHGAVDALSLRFYLLAHPGPRLEGMIKNHGKHPRDGTIPATVRATFLGADELRWNDRDRFHDVVMTKFEEMLTAAINLVVHGQIDPPDVDPVILNLGRGPRFGIPAPAGPADDAPAAAGQPA